MITPNLQKLLDALRSGDFRQGQNALSYFERGDWDGDEVMLHCCLGVASHLCAEVGGVRREERLGDIVYGAVNQAFYMPVEVKDWLGVKASDFNTGGAEHGYDLFAKHPDTGDTVMASHLNDEGYTFEQIADAIEDYYREEN